MASGLLNFVFLTLLLIAIIMAIKHKFGQQTFDKYPDFTVLSSELNTTWKYSGVFYYVHFFAIWSLIALLVLISPLVSSKILWGLLLVFQGICTAFHVVKIYNNLADYLLALNWEIFLSIAILLLFINNFVSSKGLEYALVVFVFLYHVVNITILVVYKVIKLVK